MLRYFRAYNIYNEEIPKAHKKRGFYPPERALQIVRPLAPHNYILYTACKVFLLQNTLSPFLTFLVSILFGTVVNNVSFWYNNHSQESETADASVTLETTSTTTAKRKEQKNEKYQGTTKPLQLRPRHVFRAHGFHRARHEAERPHKVERGERDDPRAQGEAERKTRPLLLRKADDMNELINEFYNSYDSTDRISVYLNGEAVEQNDPDRLTIPPFAFGFYGIERTSGMTNYYRLSLFD